MTTQQPRSSKAAPMKLVTTNTGRILRINPEEEAAKAAATAAGTAVGAPAAGRSTGGVQPAFADPARRADVLFRVRRDEGHEISSWWMIGAFLVTSGLVIALLSGVPYIA